MSFRSIAAIENSKKDYIRYVQFMKKEKFYKHIHQEFKDLLVEIGKRYDLHPDMSYLKMTKEIDFVITDDGLRDKESYIRYVKWVKRHGMYEVLSPETIGRLQELGAKYTLHPDDVSSPIGNVFYIGSWPVK